MKKTLSLLKAVLSQDMDLIKVKPNKNSSKLTKMLFPVVMIIMVLFAVGVYAYIFAEKLAPVGMVSLVIAMFTLLVAVLALFEGVYKTQSILFDSKDNDLLLSLPISRSSIFFVRVFKFLLFELLYSLLIMVPSVAVYAYFAHPGIYFYILSVFMLILLPIIPTVLAAIIGSFVRIFASKFKSSKTVQMILSFGLFFGVLYLSFNIDGFITNIAKNATTINDVITKIYYPAGVYIDLIEKFDFVKLLIFVLISFASLGFIIMIGGKFYFEIINATKKKKVGISKKEIKFTKHSSTYSLIKREITRYFSSSVYIFNTMFGLLLALIGTVAMCINKKKFITLLSTMIGTENVIGDKYLVFVFIEFLVLMSCMTSISSSAISLEGKSFNLTKTLPISEYKLLFSKVLTSVLICLPFLFLSIIIFTIGVGAGVLEIVYAIMVSIITPFMINAIGILINLMYPKLDANNDTEVIKQSKSSFISVYVGMIIGALSMVGVMLYIEYAKYIVPAQIIIFILVSLILNKLLKTYGSKKIKELNA